MATSTFRKLATKVIAEAVQEATKAAVASVPGGAAVAALAGSTAKDVVEILSEQASRMEKQLDKVLREPLYSGCRFLHEALIHPVDTRAQRQSRDALAQSAHEAFTRAYRYTADSFEDETLLRAFDCLALALFTGRDALARIALDDLASRIVRLRERVSFLEKEVRELSDYAAGFKRMRNATLSPGGGEIFVIVEKQARSRAMKAAQELEALISMVAVIDVVATVTRMLLPLSQS